MKEIYDEKNKGQNNRSLSKSSRKNEYSSTESYDNIMSQYKKTSDLQCGTTSLSAKNYKKLSENYNYNQKIKIDEVSFSHKKPNLQNKLYMKYNENSGKILF